MTLSSEVSARAQKDQNEGLSAGLNLIRDRWIPVRRKDGTVEKIRPAEVLDFGPDGENPPVAVAAVRPDFNSALIQFLIGIFQTAVAPKREGDWRKTWKNQPSVGFFSGAAIMMFNSLMEQKMKNLSLALVMFFVM